MKSEDRLIERLRELFPPGDGVRVGIGDDAAVIRATARETAVTTDVLVEGVDFLPGEDPETIGRRAAAVNLSDLAAVGARPRWFLLTVGFPGGPERGEDFVLGICRGTAARAAEYGASLVGGDLSSSPVLFVSVAMAGELSGEPMTRSGALIGHALFLSGPTGRAAGGLALARDGAPAALSAESGRGLLDAYRNPQPRLELGLELAGRGLASAAIDVSDGLGIDAGRLARASGVRAVLERSRIPIAPSVAELAGLLHADPLDFALAGGDDYELLFAAPQDRAPAILALPGVVRVGFLEEGSGAVLRDASEDRDVSDLGWDHVEAAT